jgi:hypothetical protein
MISFLAFVLIFLRESILINVRNYPFDDGLFIGRAESLIGNTEKTLGSTRGFNPLVKGQIYPFVLEISNFLNLSPLVLVYVIYLFALILFIFFLYKKNKSLILIFSFILFVFFDPSPFSSQASRIGREFFYEIIVLLSFILIVALKFIFFESKIKLTFPFIFLFGISSGFLIFLANNTREERIWIYLIWLVGFFWMIWKKSNVLLPVILMALVSMITYTSINYLLKSYNEHVFGIRLTSTTIEGEFPKLMSNLASINVDEKSDPYVSISELKRKIAYENSENFSLLKNYLEGEGKAWIQFGCSNSLTCDDYSNGWFHVALRVAIDNQGFWLTQRNAQEFMKSINNELELACTSKLIECNKALPIAKALGVTKITRLQLFTSIKFMELYLKNSIFGWNSSAQEFNPYDVMDEKQWERWKFVVKSLPDNQTQYQNQYNHRITLFNPIYQKWVAFYEVIGVVGVILFLFITYRIIFYSNRFEKKDLLYISMAIYALFIWLTRGALLAINSSTNFISIAENYALPGRVFLPIALSIFFYTGVKIILEMKNEK